jgi:hypothetical protein
MELKEIRQLIEQEHGKVIIVEEGQPVLIISEYTSRAHAAQDTVVKSQPVPESIEVRQKPADELTIDDLPV